MFQSLPLQTGKQAQSTPNPQARSELNLLSAIMTPPKPAAEDNFKLNLFGDDDDIQTEAVPSLMAKTTVTVPSYTFEHSKNESTVLARVMKDFTLDTPKPSSQTAAGDDDLLELMDSVS